MTKVQDTLNKIYKWIADNGMALNTDKRVILRIGALQPGPRHYKGSGGEELQFKQEAKDLGLMALSKGTYEPQVEIARKR